MPSPQLLLVLFGRLMYGDMILQCIQPLQCFLKSQKAPPDGIVLECLPQVWLQFLTAAYQIHTLKDTHHIK